MGQTGPILEPVERPVVPAGGDGVGHPVGQQLSWRYSGETLEREMRDRISFRPDVEHALGWWMTSRISSGGARRDAAVALLEDPYSVFRRYAESVREHDEGLGFSGDAVSYVESLAPRPRDVQGF